MIVVSASMKKSGSGWYFNLTNDLLIHAGFEDVRELRKKYGLEKVMRDGNCRVNTRHPLKMGKLLVPHLRGNSFVIKTHRGVSATLKTMMTLGVAKSTYIYRDPRDVVLSALDHGQQLRDRGNVGNVLSHLHTVEDSVLYVKKMLDIWEEWTSESAALIVRYEDLVLNPQKELRHLADFLSIEIEDNDLEAILARYQKRNQSQSDKRNLHFNKGIAGRFKETMSQKELDFCDQHFGSHLMKMGYAA